MRRLLPLAAKHGTPVTFRAAGTSLSGQAVTDSVLLKLSHGGKAFRGYEVLEEGRAIALEPGVIGGEANRLLAAYAKSRGLKHAYKIGPDPSSIDAAMIGGIVANNASGMCCGVAQNSYHTVRDMRIVFVDGSLLDTADPASVAEWSAAHAQLLHAVSEVAARVQADATLAALIRKKFSIKCTTGYSINALIDSPADKPIEIIKVEAHAPRPSPDAPSASECALCLFCPSLPPPPPSPSEPHDRVRGHPRLCLTRHLYHRERRPRQGEGGARGAKVVGWVALPLFGKPSRSLSLNYLAGVCFPHSSHHHMHGLNPAPLPSHMPPLPAGVCLHSLPHPRGGVRRGRCHAREHVGGRGGAGA